MSNAQIVYCICLIIYTLFFIIAFSFNIVFLLREAGDYEKKPIFGIAAVTFAVLGFISLIVGIVCRVTL